MSASPGALRSLSSSSDLREVVGDDPRVVGERRFEVEEHLPARDAPHLGEAGGEVVPVVHRQHGHRGVERAVAERQGLRDARVLPVPRPSARCSTIVCDGSTATTVTIASVRRSRCRHRRSRRSARRRARRGCGLRSGDRSTRPRVRRADAVVLGGVRDGFTAARAAAQPSRSRSPPLLRPCGLPCRRSVRTPAPACSTVSTPKITGTPVSSDDAGDPGRALAGDVLEVRRVAAHDGTDADHRVGRARRPRASARRAAARTRPEPTRRRPSRRRTSRACAAHRRAARR